MSLDRVADTIAEYMRSLKDVKTVAREDPEPMTFSESSADIFVRRLIVTWHDGSRYRVEIRPTP